MQKCLKSILVYTLLTVYWRKAEVDVTFKLVDISTGGTFWGARVTFNSEKGVTDTTGEVQFTTNAGTYNYDIDKLYYQHETGTVSVQSDTTLYFAGNSNPAGMEIISDSRKIICWEIN